MLKEGKKEKIIGIVILVVIIIIALGAKALLNKDTKNVNKIYAAVGGGKEDFLADEDVKKILADKYGLEIMNESWSNGKLVKESVFRQDGGKYDLIFFSDQRFYDYYKLPPKVGEASREYVVDGGLTLNTPIVIYSWDTVVDALIEQKIVTVVNGVHYITDMEKLINYILEGKKWGDIGLDIYGYINIDSTDPVTSSPGATYYGLLLSIMSEGQVTEFNIKNSLPKLKEFYLKSGYMNNTPADLFEMYLKTGVGSKPMIVDYEKSIIEFKNANPQGWEQVKDKVRILYPTPTIWNSHCIATFNELGTDYLKAFQDTEIQQIAWEKYGFRVGITGGNYNVSTLGIDGIPQSITSVTSGLKMDIYNEFIEYLSK